MLLIVLTSKVKGLQKTLRHIFGLSRTSNRALEGVLRPELASQACHFIRVSLVCFRNYEQIVKAHQDNPNEGKDQVSDQVKFNVFQGIMDSLFQSFNASISVASFQELSACVFSWIEEHCKPQVRTRSRTQSNMGQALA